MTFKWGDLQVQTRGDLTILWRDKRDIRILTNIHDTPAGGNFCDTNGKAIKIQIVVDYDRHTGYVDKVDRMRNKLHKQLQESEPQENLNSPSVAKVNNSVPVLQKHILRGKERLDWLRNLNTRFEKKDCDRQTAEGNLHCIIKELCVKLGKPNRDNKWRMPLCGWIKKLNKKLQNINNDKKEVVSALHGEMK